MENAKFTLSFRRLVAVLTGMISLTACGSNAPIDVLSNNNTPVLEGILQSGTYAATLISGFTSNNPYWVFSGGNFGSGGVYTAPAAGFVSRIDLAQLNGVAVTFVTIIHSGNLATRVYGMQVVNVRQGDPVTQGSVIGDYITSGQVAFQVLLNDVPVCPLSYMASDFRQQLATTGSAFYSQLCAQ